MEGKRQEFGGTIRSKVPEGNLDLQLICYKLTAVAQKKKKKKSWFLEFFIQKIISNWKHNFFLLKNIFLNSLKSIVLVKTKQAVSQHTGHGMRGTEGNWKLLYKKELKRAYMWGTNSFHTHILSLWIKLYSLQIPSLHPPAPVTSMG